MTTSSTTDIAATRARITTAIEQLAVANGELAAVLANLTAVVAEEALRNAGFGARLRELLVVDRGSGADEFQESPPTVVAAPQARIHAKPRAKRTRRALGPWDPYDVYTEVGEEGLRQQLSRLELEQLRDIIAEHGMNSDGLAMRWTKSDRVVGRIVERVVDRAAKGDAFRRA